MEITVERKYRKAEYTIGELRIDGVRVCNTLEPADRGLQKRQPLSAIRKAKQLGKTAIPAGSYSVRMAYSVTFRRKRPYVLSVPGYTGIMIHEGNTVEDTHGCILVGHNRRRGMVLESRKCLQTIMDYITQAENSNVPVTLVICENNVKNALKN